MSATATASAPLAPSVRPARSPWRRRPLLTALIFLTPTSIALSAFWNARINVGGLGVHPFLLPATMIFLVVALPNLGRFPRRMIGLMVLFLLLFISAMIQGGDGLLGEAVKIASLFVTILAVAAGVYVIGDSRPAIVGLCLGVALMSLHGLQGLGSERGLAVIENANKNAYSIYALPAILVAAVALVQRTGYGWGSRLVLAASSVIIGWTVFSTGNRSGWLGVAIIVLMVMARGRSVRGRVLLGVLVVAGYLLVTRISGTDIIEQRVEVTQKGYASDVKRQDLIKAAFGLAVENPLLGVSPLLLPDELARRIKAPEPRVDPHNTFGYVAGGAGLLTFAVFLLLGWTFITSRPTRRAKDLDPPARDALSLLRMLMVLFVVRGMFSRELLYNPSFACAFGVGIGEALLYGLWKRRPRSRP